MVGFAKANTKIGFGQVEPNHISGNVDGSVYAQYPANTAKMGTILEQGRFAKYDGAASDGKGGFVNEVNLTGAGAWMMIYNEEKLPDPRKQNHKDFALKAVDYTDNEITPRLIEINVGDIFTTNTIIAEPYENEAAMLKAVNALTDSAENAFPTVAIGATLKIDSASGYLCVTGGDSNEEFTVIKPFAGNAADMPDGQPAVKLMRTK